MFFFFRRVEITGPVERKMVINALNSGAKVSGFLFWFNLQTFSVTRCLLLTTVLIFETFMADFEDSHCPTWDGNLNGQINLRDAIARTISYHDPRKNKSYKLNDNPAVLIVR